MMATWTEPVFDRTQSDVGYALTKIAEWISNGFSVKPDNLKGCLNATDLNRIESNIAYLAEKLSELGYYPDTEVKSWDISGLPDRRDVLRILANLASVEAVYITPRDAPEIPDNMVHFEEINDIEENLYLIKQLLDNMVSSFKKSNTFQSGGTMFLPLRR